MFGARAPKPNSKDLSPGSAIALRPEDLFIFVLPTLWCFRRPKTKAVRRFVKPSMSDVLFSAFQHFGDNLSAMTTYVKTGQGG